MERDKLELGRLATPEGGSEEDSEEEEEEEEKQGGVEEEVMELKSDLNETYGEDVDQENEEEEDMTNEERVSLLEGRTSPLPTQNNSELPRTASTVVILPGSNLMVTQAKLATTDPDIQLAEVDVPQYRPRRSPPANMSHLSSIHTICGPKPAKITVACVLVLSLWAAFMLLIHMNKKIDTLSSSLTSTNDKLKTMEEVNEEYRSQIMSKLQRMSRVVHSLREARVGKTIGKDPSPTKSRVPTVTTPSIPLSSRHPPQQTTPSPSKTQDEDPFSFDDDWWQGWSG